MRILLAVLRRQRCQIGIVGRLSKLGNSLLPTASLIEEYPEMKGGLDGDRLFSCSRFTKQRLGFVQLSSFQKDCAEAERGKDDRLTMDRIEDWRKILS
jgi:hypothetical protein